MKRNSYNGRANMMSVSSHLKVKKTYFYHKIVINIPHYFRMILNPDGFPNTVNCIEDI